MDFDRINSYVVSFYHTHMPFAIAIAIAIFVIAYWKPKIVFKFVCAVIFIAFIFYIFSLLSGVSKSGIKQKERMFNKTEESLK